MRNLVAHELARLHAKNERLERRLALLRISGKVHEVDAAKRRLRLRIGTTANGQPVLSPWVRWQEAGAGGLKIHSQPAIGEQMALVSQSGTVGSVSIAVPATYDKDNAPPSTSSESTIFERGSVLEIGPNGIIVTGPLHVNGGTITNDGVDVGKGHMHSGDDLDGITGPPLGT